MPNPNAIVGLIAQIDPAIDRPGPQTFRDRPEGVSVQIEGQRPARLTASDRAQGQLEILLELQRIQHPAYLEISPDTGAITRLLVPLVVKVASVRPSPEGALVELEISHARHVLRRDTPDFEELLRTLRDAEGKDAFWIVTETDDHDIIDVRPFLGARAFARPAPRNVLLDVWYWICSWFFGCVSQSTANAMFNMVSATSCNPLTVPAPCIPFLYPDDGCWGRASEMCRLMIAAGRNPGKVWIYGSLNAKTRNNPNCQVFWGWHVAPTLCVRLSWLSTQRQVIDPSLFTKPVTEATWKSVQGDPNAQLVDTAASVFWRGSNGATTTDPTYAQTNQVLATYRLKLKNRSLSAVGAPPYANCP